jgi:hypothetical protein
MEFLSILVLRTQVMLCPGHHLQDDEIKIPLILGTFGTQANPS